MIVLIASVLFSTVTARRRISALSKDRKTADGASVLNTPSAVLQANWDYITLRGILRVLLQIKQFQILPLLFYIFPLFR